MFAARHVCSIDYPSNGLRFVEMSPSSFTFKLTVPNDPEGISVLAALAAHAVEYAKIEAAAGAAFLERVRDAASKAMAPSGGGSCLAEVTAADGQLTVTIGAHTASQALPA
jgi:hypothetical protein